MIEFTYFVTNTEATPQLKAVPTEVQLSDWVQVAARAHIINAAGLNNIGHFYLVKLSVK